MPEKNVLPKYFPAKQRILIVGEYLQKQNILSEILSPAGYESQQIQAGEPNTIKKGERSDLIILDIQTSNAWGIELLSKLKSNSKTEHIPIIFLSTFTEIQDKEKVFGAGCYDYITKPYSVGEVFVRVKNCLMLHQYQMQLENVIQKRTAELKQKTLNLEESNVALRILLKQQEDIKKDLEKNILFSVNKLVKPSLKKLKNSASDINQKIYIEVIESNLKNITAPFSQGLADNLSRLTPTEIHIADLIRMGKTTKEIASLLRLSPTTIATHRQNIRKKLVLTNKKKNLRTILASN